MEWTETPIERGLAALRAGDATRAVQAHREDGTRLQAVVYGSHLTGGARQLQVWAEDPSLPAWPAVPELTAETPTVDPPTLLEIQEAVNQLAHPGTKWAVPMFAWGPGAELERPPGRAGLTLFPLDVEVRESPLGGPGAHGHG